MKKYVNLHSLERVARFVFGIILCVIAAPGTDFLGESIFKYLVFIFGLINIPSALVGWCWLYQVLGLSTVPGADDEK